MLDEKTIRHKMEHTLRMFAKRGNERFLEMAEMRTGISTVT